MRINKKKEIYGKQIITYKGEPVLTSDPIYTDEDNLLIDKVICTCGRIVQQRGWTTHIRRPLCVEYHMITEETPNWNPI